MISGPGKTTCESPCSLKKAGLQRSELQEFLLKKTSGVLTRIFWKIICDGIIHPDLFNGSKWSKSHLYRKAIWGHQSSQHHQRTHTQCTTHPTDNSSQYVCSWSVASLPTNLIVTSVRRAIEIGWQRRRARRTASPEHLVPVWVPSWSSQTWKMWRFIVEDASCIVRCVLGMLKIAMRLVD